MKKIIAYIPQGDLHRVYDADELTTRCIRAAAKLRAQWPAYDVSVCARHHVGFPCWTNAGLDYEAIVESCRQLAEEVA